MYKKNPTTLIGLQENKETESRFLFLLNNLNGTFFKNSILTVLADDRICIADFHSELQDKLL